MIEVVYVLGSTRSGTSALRNALATTRFHGYGEGHLVPLLMDIISAVRRQGREGMGASVPGNGLKELRAPKLLRHLFRGYEAYLSEQLRSRHVIDKTPTIVPIEASPLLNTLHTAPRFIYCSRRHVDNVRSKLKKFPGRTVEQHAREWTGCSQAWQRVREELDGNFLALDFYDVATDPAGTGERIGHYLGLEAAEVASLSAYLTSQRPESVPGRDLTDFHRLSEMEWSAAEKEALMSICGPMGTELGYGWESYWAEPSGS
ncbi:sulfotransferase [Acuticoccus sediminis]|uniref:sulfotransferase n=1 Tax=Acuticoccus sediminis TaxID=2184697 RepID=UPI001CFDEF1F|nr:sulfotransferase [Acuticoccus sediminis]